ncbi:MAG: special sigma factor [Weeksellaceae bacterium]|nr:special sigma factor [Weeksellaceae bacterium]
MKDDFLKTFVLEATQENEQKMNAEKRRKHFQELGRKGGLKKNSSSQLKKIISFRVTDLEFEDIQKKSKKYHLKIGTYARMVFVEKELKVNEFETDKVLLDYGNNFIRITNLLRNKEWNFLENKKKILEEIQTVLELIRHYLYSKMNTDE